MDFLFSSRRGFSDLQCTERLERRIAKGLLQSCKVGDTPETKEGQGRKKKEKE